MKFIFRAYVFWPKPRQNGNFITFNYIRSSSDPSELSTELQADKNCAHFQKIRYLKDQNFAISEEVVEHFCRSDDYLI